MFCRNKTNIQSFTLIEVLIAMIVSTIVIGATIAIWLCIEGLFNQGMNDTYGETAAVLFISTFEADLKKAENIKANSSEVIFSFTECPDIQYSFNDKIVTRTILEKADTFHIGIDDVQITKHEKLPNVVKSIAFSVLLKNKVIPLFLTKDYSNSRLFNYRIEQNEP
jgi:competence protein ComGF